jgi:hypothetical protein
MNNLLWTGVRRELEGRLMGAKSFNWRLEFATEFQKTPTALIFDAPLFMTGCKNIFSQSHRTMTFV